jgi:2-oxoglutarate dehydrogenase E1 component
MESESFLGNIDPQAVDKLYKDYLANPSSVEEGWRNFFKGFDFALSGNSTNGDQHFDSEV